MKNTLVKTILRLTVLSGLVLSALSQAALINRGSGLIYDDVLDVTWMQDANYLRTNGIDADGNLDFADASSWVETLNFAGYDDWRLPNHSPLNGSTFDIALSFDGTTDRGYNDFSQSSELSYMFHHNLANTSYFDTNINSMQAGSETFKSSFLDGVTGELFSFENIGFTYWSDPVNNPITNVAWGFSFIRLSGTGPIATGANQLLNTFSELKVWVLRDGDVFANTPSIDPPVAVNAPSTFAMLFFGIAGALAVRRQTFS